MSLKPVCAIAIEWHCSHQAHYALLIVLNLCYSLLQKAKFQRLFCTVLTHQHCTENNILKCYKTSKDSSVLLHHIFTH